MEEKRIIKQIPQYDEYNNLKYTIIPNYRERKNFLTENEMKFYYALKKALKISKKLPFDIFSQVALNRIIEVNNSRAKNENDLGNKITMWSIDFVLYDTRKNKIVLCIELDDPTHKTRQRKERDDVLNNALESNVKILHIETQNFYEPLEIRKLILIKLNEKSH